jgi:signal transduction histidine kinase
VGPSAQAFFWSRMIQVRQDSKKRIIALALVAFAMTEVAFYEATLVGPQASLLLSLKLIAPACLVVAAFWAWRHPHSLGLKICVAIVFVYYPAVSSLFRPWYILAVLQLLLIYACFFDARPKLYWSFAVSAVLAFYIPFWLRWPNVPENSVRLGFGDWISICLQQLAILSLTYVFVIGARNFERKTQASLLAIGRHAARVTHDLKGMLAAPLLYLDHAKAVLAQQANLSPAILESVAQTQRELGELHLAVSELTRLTSTEGLPTTSFSFSECVHSTSLLFRSELMDRGYEEDESLRRNRWIVGADRSHVATIVFELFSLALATRDTSQASESSMKIRSHFSPSEKAYLLTIESARGIRMQSSGDNFERVQNLARELGTRLRKIETDGSLIFEWQLERVLQNRREI